MAEKSLNGVEAVIHKAVRELAADVQKEFGMTIDSIDIDWTKISTTSGSSFMVDRIRIQTSS